MNLLGRTVVLSLLPLGLVLVLAIPEGFLQLRVSSDMAQEQHDNLAVSAARDIADRRFDALNALRRLNRGNRAAAVAYKTVSAEMRAAMIRLGQTAGPDPTAIADSRPIIATAAVIVGFNERIASEIRAGHHAEAAAGMTDLAYYDAVERLQRSVTHLVDAGRAKRLEQFASFQRLWSTSVLLLTLAVAGLVLTSALQVFYAARAVGAIFALVRKGDSYRRGEPLGSPSTRGDEIGLLDISIHELIADHEAHERQLERYRLLVDVTQDIVFFVDRVELTVIEANAAALAAYGYEREALVGKPLQILKPGGAPLDLSLVALSDQPSGITYETMQRRSDGTVFPIEISARTAEVDGRRTIICTGREITERRRAAEQVAQALDQALEASRLKSEFVATMSHEIRTPLYGVIGMSELLSQAPLPAPEHEYATTVRDSAQALLAIVNDILDFSRLEAHKVELEAVMFDPVQLLDGAVSLARGAAHEKGLTLRTLTSPEVPRSVRGDPTRLGQVLNNLIGNAVKFTADGEVCVSMSITQATPRSVDLQLTVSDTGIGVATEARETLFDAFVQGDGSTTRRFGGSGLGLTISRRLVELMGGRIWLGEHEGRGSTFAFTVRLERVLEDGAQIPAPIAPPRSTLAGSMQRRARLLMAEDSALVRRVAHFQLEELGHDVTIVEDGQQAVAEAISGNYDLVLMDMRMPEMDGLTATRAIRTAERENGRHVVIVALTANVLAGDQEACIAAGMDDFLAKPLQLGALRLVLDRWLPESVS